MVDHVWVQENLDAYLAGEMTRNEREKVDRHVAVCDDCEQALLETRSLEQVMAGLFADARPSPNLDGRVIARLQRVPARSAKLPMIWRIAASAAAVLVIGMVGWVAQTLSTESSDPTNDLNQVAVAGLPKLASADNGKRVDHASAPSDVNAIINQMEHALATGKSTKDVAAGYTEGKLKDLAEGLTIEQKRGRDELLKNQEVVEVMKESAKKFTEEIEREKNAGAATETLKMKKGIVFDDRDNFFARPGKDKELQGGATGDKGGDKGEKAERPAGQPLYKPVPPLDVAKSMKDLETIRDKLDKYDKSPEFKGKNKPNAEGPPASKMPPIGPIGLPMPPGYGLGGGGPIFAPPGTPPGGIIPAMTTPPPPAPPVPVLPSYFDENKKDSGKPTGQPGKGKYDEAEGKQGGDPKQGDAKKGDPDGKEKGQSKDPEGDNKPGDKAPKGSETPKADPKPKVEEPIDAGRKIIRTGEMEFEVEKFDDARNIIIAILKGDKKDGKVIYAGVPGGFVATSNSDQLPNGKMRGSIVVRMPPQHLDEFIRDLRRALTVKGELKNERITSLDVTKQYTDMESRLRAARTMEERLIQIIKIGKGEIKDLVAAERELGVWRTKIEEMEGEIRYYSNQVSLSTLTITLTEKEIFAPASVVLTENVKLRVEVDNVAEAHQAAMAAVEEFKGTLTKSDLKLHPGGQLQSIIQAEIPPANKKDFTKKIEKLGIPSDYQEFQYQHTEGGTGKALSLKQRKGDVRFDLTMFNNANIRPRLASDLKIATADVPGDYAKILESVAKVRGQVRDAKLNEQDKLNINAYVDFNVPTSEKPAIDKLLFDIGPILERVNIRAPFSELSTERKFGYTVMLRDFAAIPPTKSAVETIATTDVPAAYAKLQEAIAKVKGLITDARVNDQDKMNVNAQIDFSIPSEEFAAFEKILKDLGMSLSRTNVQAPMKQLSTGRKFGYSIALRDFASIPPSKAVFEVIATADVPDAYARLQEAITKVKGLVADARVNEQDKMNVNAQLDFTIPSEEVAAIEKILKDLGTALVRTSMQAPMKQLSTARRFGYSIALRDFASVPPSKMVIERIAVKDVPTTYLKVLDAINKAKAVVVDSKLNEQDKTNVNAQLDFTVMIEEKPTIDALVTGLGISLTRTNVQTPVNVMSTTKKFGYMLDLRDLATVPPTKYTDQKIATNDVPANYAKLLDAVAKIDGHVANAKLYEEDKLNIKAEIGFSVPTDKKGGIDKLLDDIGPLLSRNNAETPANQLRTDKKFGYSIELHDFASIRPSHFSKVTIAASKVPANYAMLLEAIAKVKGQIHAANLNEQDKLNITGVIDFSVPSTEKKAIEDLLGEVGTVLSRTNDQTPANVRSTDRKYGFAVTMSDFANIPARETFILQIAMNDVPATFRELQATVGKAKGWISVGQLREDNKAKIEAQLNFDVPVSEKAAIETALLKAGATVLRTSSQLPVNQLATDQKVGYQLRLRDFATIPARETSIVQLATNDVPATFRELQDAISHAKGWVSVGTLKEDEKAKLEGHLNFDIPLAERAPIERILAKGGATVKRTSKQLPADLMATDHKVGYELVLRNTASIPPRDTTIIKFEVSNVDEESARMKDLVAAGKGRVIDSSVDRQENGQVKVSIIFEVPFSSQESLLRQIKTTTGKLLSQRSTRDAKVPENELTTAYIVVTLTGGTPIVGSDEGVTTYLNTGLRTSFRILAWIAMILLVGVSVVGPVLVVGFASFWMYGLMARSGPAARQVPIMEPAPEESKPTGEGDKPAGDDAPKQ